jgi:hypothetical protein
MAAGEAGEDEGMAVIVRTKLIEVVDALAVLGVPYEVLRDALLAGEIERDACTPHDPAGTPGYNAWSRCVRTLRDRLCPEPYNWEARDDNNLPLVMNVERRLAIVVASGDKATGQFGDGIGIPTTKYPMGPIVIEAVEENRRQFDLPFPDQKKPARPSRTTTYVLLRHRIRETLYAELSLPYVLGDDNRVDEWAERNILEPLTLDAPPSPTGDTDTGDIDVPVRRRS